MKSKLKLLYKHFKRGLKFEHLCIWTSWIKNQFLGTGNSTLHRWVITNTSQLSHNTKVMQLYCLHKRDWLSDKNQKVTEAVFKDVTMRGSQQSLLGESLYEGIDSILLSLPAQVLHTIRHSFLFIRILRNALLSQNFTTMFIHCDLVLLQV